MDRMEYRYVSFYVMNGLGVGRVQLIFTIVLSYHYVLFNFPMQLHCCPIFQYT